MTSIKSYNIFNRDQVLVTQYGGRCVAVASECDNLYILRQVCVKTSELHLTDQQPSNLLMVWHHRLGHIGLRTLQRLASLWTPGISHQSVGAGF